jgi:uncharacterized protein (TIGR02646 family)
MIAVIRSPKPTILVRKEQDWLAALLRAVTKAEKEKATNKYRHAEIETALDTMFHGKCAYCESKIKHVSDPHIEHYRPKLTFPKFTFDWDNLLLACGTCNSTKFKGAKFPEANAGGPYINPCTDDPDEHFQFIYDPKAKLASVYGKTARGTTTEKDLGLNRPDLRTYRSKQIEILACLAQLARTDPRAQSLLDEAKQADAEYAAFANRCV